MDHNSNQKNSSFQTRDFDFTHTAAREERRRGEQRGSHASWVHTTRNSVKCVTLISGKKNT
jgi:hypothetical protein